MAVNITSSARYHDGVASPTGGFAFTAVDLSAFSEGDHIVLGITGSEAAPGRAFTQVDLNGSSNFTEIAFANSEGAGVDSSVISAIYILTAPAGLGATETINVDFDGAMDRCTIAVYQMTGAGGETAHDTISATDADPISGTIDCEADGAILAIAATFDTTDHSWTGVTEDFDEDRVIWFSGAHDEFGAAQTGLTIEADPAGSPGYTALTAASWSPPGGAAPAFATGIGLTDSRLLQRTQLTKMQSIGCAASAVNRQAT